MGARRPLFAALVSIVIVLVCGCARAERGPLTAADATTDPADGPAQVETLVSTPTEVPSATPSPTPSPTPGPPPCVVASYPIEGDLAVSAEYPLTLVFDRAVDRGSAEAGLAVSPRVEGFFEWPSDTTLVFRPTDGWTSEAYTVHLSGVRGTDGGIMSEALSLHFGTGGRGVPVPVLMYHHVMHLQEDATELLRTWTVSPAAFEEQMKYLDSEGWQAIAPSALADYFRGEPLPMRPVIITIDDGNKDIYTNAYPILMETDLRPILYVIPSHMGYGAYFDWDMTEELVKAGFHIGVHSYDHIALRGVDRSTLETQVKFAKDVLEEHLGLTLDSFCYPFGSYDEDTIAALEEHAYTTAFTLNPSLYQTPDAPYQLNRLLVTYDTSLEEFVDLLP